MELNNQTFTDIKYFMEHKGKRISLEQYDYAIYNLCAGQYGSQSCCPIGSNLNQSHCDIQRINYLNCNIIDPRGYVMPLPPIDTKKCGGLFYCPDTKVLSIGIVIDYKNEFGVKTWQQDINKAINDNEQVMLLFMETVDATKNHSDKERNNQREFISNQKLAEMRQQLSHNIYQKATKYYSFFVAIGLIFLAIQFAIILWSK
jgi:hypothetical protein